MSRKLPLCAWCGESLCRRAKLMLEMTGQPGRPMVGWHISPASDPRQPPSCSTQDPVRANLMASIGDTDNEDAIALRIIGQRGPGRIATLNEKGK